MNRVGPIVPESCDGCGVCCRVVGRPPFVRRLDGSAEDAWNRLCLDRPDLARAVLDHERARRDEGLPAHGDPCPWHDAVTGLCRHYEYRPVACREFAVGSVDCLDARRRAGIAS